MSDLSDDDDYMLPSADIGKKKLHLLQELKPTTMPKIRKLFYNSDKVSIL